MLDQPIGTLWSNNRARPTARSPPCRPHASVSPLQVPVAAPSVRGGTPRTRVPGVCNRHNTSRLVRGRLRKIWRHASPRRPPATVVDARSPLQVPVAAPSVRGGTPRTRVPGVCNRHNTSRLVRGRLRKIWRHASPRRPPATVVDARRAIRVEGIFRILLHHQKL